MTPAITWATALRVLTQLRRDPRTIALIVVVPSLLVAILRYVFDGRPEIFDRVGGPMLGLFPFISMFLVTSVTMLRERVTGTLERLMTTPLAKLDLLLGYAIAFETARSTTSQRGPDESRSSSPNATTETSVAWTAATAAKASP